MFNRPRQFQLLAAILVAVAASFPVQVMVGYGYTLAEFDQLMAGLAPLNWLVFASALVHATLVYQASPLVLASTPLFLLAVVWNNWVAAAAGLNVSTAVAALATLGAFAVHLPLLQQAPRRVLANPRLRWWRTAKRRRASVTAIIRPVLGGEVRASTFDVSVGGAFLALGAEMNRNLKVGSRCSIRLVLDQLHVIQCAAEVVRHAQPTGSYPAGFGVRFICLDDSQRKALSNFVDAGAAAG
ncbi:MAG: PilZ domain-containing protein [Oligoflexia bacterium]|nr:PilZ domain-containing protein [Oligoflexia bacterium]